MDVKHLIPCPSPRPSPHGERGKGLHLWLLAVLILTTGVLATVDPVAGAERPGLPEGKAVLRGTVLSKEMLPLPAVLLCLKNEQGIRFAVTDQEGVSVVKVPGGTYSLKVELDGFVTQELEEVRLIEEKELKLDFILLEVEGDVITYTDQEPRNDC